MLHVDIPSRAEIEALNQDLGPLRVTLYLPTTPITKHAQADRIVLKNLTTEALAQLADHDKRQVRVIEEMLFDLVDDDDFWALQANSLAIFATPKGVRTFRLPNRLEPRVEVGERFLVKPLLRAVTAPQSAFVLALAHNGARLVEVSADLPALEVRVDGMPQDAARAAGKASINDRSPSGRIQGAEGIKVRLAQYSRKVDQALRDLLGGRETPLILAATEPLLSIFRSVCSYPHLVETAISTNPEAMSDAELAAASRTILDDLFRQELAAFQTLFAERRNQGRATTDVAQAARAATQGAVQTLLVDIDRVMPGTVDEQGKVTFADDSGPTNHNIVDEIASRALATRARVLAVRGADIPDQGSLAAILRYPC